MNARYLLTSILILLAVIGLGATLINNPMSLLRNIVISLAVIGIILFIYRKWISGKPSNTEQKAFVKAAKQSKKRINKKSVSQRPSSAATQKKSYRKKSTAKLTVIEGKKNKKNNRASF